MGQLMINIYNQLIRISAHNFRINFLPFLTNHFLSMILIIKFDRLYYPIRFPYLIGYGMVILIHLQNIIWNTKSFNKIHPTDIEVYQLFNDFPFSFHLSSFQWFSLWLRPKGKHIICLDFLVSCCLLACYISPILLVCM